MALQVAFSFGVSLWWALRDSHELTRSWICSIQTKNLQNFNGINWGSNYRPHLAWNFRQLSCALGDSVRFTMLEGFASALKDFEHPSSGSEFRSGKWCFLVILTPSVTDRTQKLLPNNYSIRLATATSIATTQFLLCKLSKRGNSHLYKLNRTPHL